MQARREGISLNQYIVYALARQSASVYTIQILPRETVEYQHKRFEQILESLGEASITATEAFLAERETAEREVGLSDDIVASIEAHIAAHKTAA
jgi:hypothetical protein